MKHLNRGHILRAQGPLLKTKHFKCGQKLFMIKDQHVQIRIQMWKQTFKNETWKWSTVVKWKDHAPRPPDTQRSLEPWVIIESSFHSNSGRNFLLEAKPTPRITIDEISWEDLWLWHFDTRQWPGIAPLHLLHLRQVYFFLAAFIFKVLLIALRSRSQQTYAGIELNSMATYFYVFFLIISSQVLELSPLLSIMIMACYSETRISHAQP